MTNEEAYKHIKSRFNVYVQCTDDNFALHTALEALENDELKQKLFELMLFIDTESLKLKEPERIPFRAKHFQNMRFVVDNKLEEEYYDYFFENVVKPLAEKWRENNETSE